MTDKKQPSKKVVRLGIDIAKNVFQLHGVDCHEKPVLTRSAQRSKLLQITANLPPCIIGMEACGGSHHWAREFIKQGHDVKLVAAQFVKPYVKNNKNDANDAEAICEVTGRPRTHFVTVKTMEQHDIQSLHRVRQSIQQTRVAQGNQIRGLLSEFGIVIPKRADILRKELPCVLEDADNGLTTVFRNLLFTLYDTLRQLDSRLHDIDKEIESFCRSNDICSRVTEIRGIGPITATALYAAVGTGRQFKNGRLMSAWLGLVPRQHSSGGKEKLLGISKRGNSYLRMLLINGGRVVVQHSERNNDTISLWARELKKRKCANKTGVACANKLGRIAWAIMHSDERYKAVA